MFETVTQVDNDSRIEDKLREAMIKQMEIGYQEMGALNLEMCNEYYNAESDAEMKNENIWKI